MRAKITNKTLARSIKLAKMLSRSFVISDVFKNVAFGNLRWQTKRAIV